MPGRVHCEYQVWAKQERPGIVGQRLVTTNVLFADVVTVEGTGHVAIVVIQAICDLQLYCLL